MILQTLLFVFALGCSLISPLYAGSARADQLIAESAGIQGAAGIVGVAGPAGLPGVPGIPGTASVLDYSDFFALMPGDNPATVALNMAVMFPQNGPFTGLVTRAGPGIFNLPGGETFLVLFQVSVSEPGQLALRLNGVTDLNTVVGRATGANQIVGMYLVTTAIPTTLEVINVNAAPALTITPIAGGTHSVSAHLTIVRVQ